MATRQRPRLIDLIKRENGILPGTTPLRPEDAIRGVWYSAIFFSSTYIVRWIMTSLSDNYFPMEILGIVLILFLVALRTLVTSSAKENEESHWRHAITFILDSVISLFSSTIINLNVAIVASAVDLNDYTIIGTLSVLFVTVLVVVFLFIHPAARTLFVRVDTVPRTEPKED